MFSLRILSLLAALWLLALPAAALAGPPTEQIEQSVRRVVAILEDKALAPRGRHEERRAKLREVIYARFDFDRMAQGTLGHKWGKFNDTQQKRFVELFRQLLENTYLDKIESYQGEKWTFTKELQRNPQITRVDSVVHSKGQDYELSYQMYDQGGDWKVFDVIIEGVSLVANYRSQFSQILGNSTVEELLTKLAEKVRNKEKDLVPVKKGK